MDLFSVFLNIIEWGFLHKSTPKNLKHHTNPAFRALLMFNMYREGDEYIRRLSVYIQNVPKEGIEPSQGCPRRILSPLRLPVPPLRRIECFCGYYSGCGISSTSIYLPLARATIFPISFSISALFSITRLLFLTYHPRIYRFSLMNAGCR